jgi:hypothetical protein
LSTAGYAPSDDIKKAAREGLKVHVKNYKIDDRLRNQGFETQADLDNAELGGGLQYCFIDVNKLMDESVPQDFQSLVITPFDAWRFQVLAGGKVKSLFLRAHHVGEGISVHTISMPWLAKEMNGIMATWPTSSGYSYRFIEISQADAALIELSKWGKIVGIIPLSTMAKSPGRKEGEFKPGDVRDPQEILAKLRLLVKQDKDPERPPSDAVISAAREALVYRIKNSNIEESIRPFGYFESQAEIDNAELGEGFRGFVVFTDKLLDEPAPQDLHSLIGPTNMWYFPVLSNGKVKTLINVSFQNGKWGFFSMGQATLAMEMSGLKAKWPATSGYQYKYIKFGFVTSFFELSQRGKVLGLIPLLNISNKPGRVIGTFELGDLRDPKEILPELRLQHKQNIEQYK